MKSKVHFRQRVEHHIGYQDVIEHHAEAPCGYYSMFLGRDTTSDWNQVDCKRCWKYKGMKPEPHFEDVLAEMDW